MRCFTVQRHEPYLITLAQAFEDIHILTHFKGQQLPWQTPLTQCPQSITLCQNEEAALQQLNDGFFDLIIIHTVQDLIAFRSYSTAKIMILHIALYTHSPLWFLRSFIKKSCVQLFIKNKKHKVIATTKWKSVTWGLSHVETICTPPLPTLSTHSDTPIKAVTVGNHLNTRKEVDFSIFEQLHLSHGVEIIGCNPGVQHAHTPNGRKAYTEKLRDYQIFIFILKHPWEDAYNLAMLEAMQSGMAILTFDHPHNFIEDGLNGYICKDIDDMKKKLSFLTKNPNLVHKMGKESQHIIKNHFNINLFKKSWERVSSSLLEKITTT
ncbi:MAG: hypothetical protein AB8C84_04840 [Oligoflexales bacterium]